jgi:hypothetical protein
MQTFPKLKDEKSTDLQTPTQKIYAKPKLELWGDLRGLTLGGSPGSGESGAPQTHDNRIPGS